MKINSCKFLLFIAAFLAVAGFSITARSQSLSFDYHYKVFMEGADQPPRISGLDDIAFPDAARKNGVTGSVKATLVLGEDKRARDIVVTEGLPFGVTEAVTKILQNIYFEPAKRDGRPIASKLEFEFIVSAVYGEDDKNVTKVRITSPLTAAYPSSYTGERIKGKVGVTVLFREDGTLKIISVSSVMPREFDQAAAEAAKNIQFTPAVHKKSRKNVSQQMTVEFEFK